MLKIINQTTEYLIDKGFVKPEIGIILGTGLGKLAEIIENPIEVSYNHIPNFPTATVEFHTGRLIYGDLEGKKVVVMQGRFHLYEGYSAQDVTFPVRIMKALGIHSLLISNAAGAINSGFKKGEIMLLDDHINLQNASPLAFKGVEQFGTRFVDMSAPYSKKLTDPIIEIAKQENITLHQGVYACVTGPQLETRAEYRYLKIIGADAVGMSTVPEVIVGNHLGLDVMALSVLTDECDPDNLAKVNIEEIIAMAAKAEPAMICLFKKLIARI